MIVAWKHIVTKALPRLIFLVGFAWLCNWMYTRWYWQDDLDLHAELLSKFYDVRDSSDILYFGESSNMTTSPNDSLPLAISEFIDRDLIDYRVGTVDHAGYHVGQYLPVIKHIDPNGPVKAIIVTMNLRTFGPDVIHSPNEASLQKSSRLSENQAPLLNRFLASLNYYDKKTGHERDIMKWENWTYDTLRLANDSSTFDYPTVRRWCEVVKFPDSTGAENMPLRILADQNIKVYGFEVDEHNPMVQWCDEIVAVARQKGIHLFFSLLPENIQQSEELAGRNLAQLMRQNRDYLVHRYAVDGVTVINNLELIDDIHFLDREVFPTEHYDQFGREAIADQVSRAVVRVAP